MDPQIKRLAMQTEDHPLSYAWDLKALFPRGNTAAAMSLSGTAASIAIPPLTKVKRFRWHKAWTMDILRFGWKAKKLKGGFSLFRTARPGAKNAWLLVKMNDAEARPDQDPVAEKTTSVISGRNVEDLSGANSKTWISNRIPKQNKILPIPAAAMPAVVNPMLATLVDEPFDREGWLYEPKLDGERCLAFRKGKDLQLVTRNQKSLNVTYPQELVASLKAAKRASSSLSSTVKWSLFCRDLKIPAFVNYKSGCISRARGMSPPARSRFSITCLISYSRKRT